MSIAGALNNALSGLTATSKGTETVASNLANVMTPGYGRREVSLSSQALGGGMGGVHVEGVSRLINNNLVAESRLALSSKSEADVLSSFFSAIGTVIGLPGEQASLGGGLNEFHAALQAAAARPDDEIRLGQVVEAAVGLTAKLNEASAAVQDARSNADTAIAAEVSQLNEGLELVALLNRKIARATAEGMDVSGLTDQRQNAIDLISRIVPLQEISRDHGAVALFTTEGVPLLDGSRPTEIGYQSVGQMTPDLVVGTPPVGRLIVNGQELSQDRMRLFAGGSLAANFAIRDEHAPQIQAELDALALDIYQRISTTSVDPTLGLTDPGLFTDAGSLASGLASQGLAARITVNATVLAGNAELWRVRDGLLAAAPGATGDSSLLTRMADALADTRPADSSGILTGIASLQGRFADVEARVATRRVDAENEATMRSGRWDVISGNLLADGVDSDAEMQRLLQYEQAYAANARVIQAIEEMMDQILRI